MSDLALQAAYTVDADLCIRKQAGHEDCPGGYLRIHSTLKVFTTERQSHLLTRWVSVSGYENEISARWRRGGADDELLLRPQDHQNLYLLACQELLDYGLIDM